MFATIRDKCSRHLLLPIHETYRRIRPDHRTVYRIAGEALEFRHRAMTMSKEQKLDWILMKLRSLLRQAGKESPFYRDLFITAGFDPGVDFGYDDFSRLPPLDRKDVLDQPDDLRSLVLPTRLARPGSTGGSSGQPVRVWKGPRDRAWTEGGWRFFTQQLGIRPGARTAYLWGHHLDAIPQRRLLPTLNDLLLNAYRFDCFHLDDVKLLGYHERLTKLRPECMVAYGGALASLAAVLERRGLRATYPSLALISGAEKIWPHERAQIERVFGQPVHERYGSRDVGLMAFQVCPSVSTAYTVDWANILIEPDTESTSPSAILVTKLNADGMFLIRYRIGDLAIFPPSARPGEPAFSLLEISGRELDGILMPSGEWIHGVAFPHLMKDHAVREFQVYQHADSSLTIKLVTHEGWKPADEVALRKQLEGIAPRLAISLSFVDQIPKSAANKRRPVISELAPQRDGSK